MSPQSYRDLIVWQKSMELAKMCYRVTKEFPKEELFGLTSQIRRAAASVAANIAEGNARNHTKEYLQFLSIARGSLAETETLLLLSENVGLLSNSHLQDCLAISDQIGRMLVALRRSLQSVSPGPNPLRSNDQDVPC
jgi:four helix bundle protein